MTAELEVVSTDEPGQFRLVGELDLTTTETLEAALREAVVPEGAELVLDLSDLAFMDSMGIRVLLTTAQRYNDEAGLVLRNPHGEVLRVLEVAGLVAGAPGLRVELEGSTGDG